MREVYNGTLDALSFSSWSNFLNQYEVFLKNFECNGLRQLVKEYKNNHSLRENPDLLSKEQQSLLFDTKYNEVALVWCLMNFGEDPNFQTHFPEESNATWSALKCLAHNLTLDPNRTTKEAFAASGLPLHF